MPDTNYNVSYSSIIIEIAEKAYNGEYGEGVFELNTPANESMLAEAWERVGQFLPEYWSPEGWDIDKPGGIIVSRIQSEYFAISEQRDVDASVFEEEKGDFVGPSTPVITTQDILAEGANDPDVQAAYAALTGSDPSAREIDSVDDNISINDTDTPPAQTDGEIDSSPALLSVDPPAAVEDHPAVTDASDSVSAPVFKDTDDLHFVYNRDGELIDVCMVTDDGLDFSLSETINVDLLAEIISLDEGFHDTIADILRYYDLCCDETFEESAPVSFVDYMDNKLAEFLENYQERERVDGPAETGSSSSDTSDETHKGAPQPDYRERVAVHDEKLQNRKDSILGVRDFFGSYHDLARTVNAYKGGVEINGKVPTKFDVFTSFYRFSKAELFETLIIDAVKLALDKPDRDNIDRGIEHSGGTSIDRVSPDFGGKDSVGIHDSGYISKDTPPDGRLQILRNDLPQAGRFYGADMSKPIERLSTSDMRVFSTNPDRVNGNGITITSNQGVVRTVPDVRMVELRGNFYLVDPFGKIIDKNERFSVENTAVERLAGLDVSSSPSMREALADLAADKYGGDLAKAKDALSNETISRFCDRIESTYAREAAAIRDNILPQEQTARDGLSEKLDVLREIEPQLKPGATLEEVKAQRVDLQAAIDASDARIQQLELRAERLENLAINGSPVSADDRLASAIDSEKNSIGRSVERIEVVSVDMPRIESLIENAKAEVEVDRDHVDKDAPAATADEVPDEDADAATADEVPDEDADAAAADEVPAEEVDVPGEDADTAAADEVPAEEVDVPDEDADAAAADEEDIESDPENASDTDVPENILANIRHEDDTPSIESTPNVALEADQKDDFMDTSVPSDTESIGSGDLDIPQDYIDELDNALVATFQNGLDYFASFAEDFDFNEFARAISPEFALLDDIIGDISDATSLDTALSAVGERVVDAFVDTIDHKMDQLQDLVDIGKEIFAHISDVFGADSAMVASDGMDARVAELDLQPQLQAAFDEVGDGVLLGGSSADPTEYYIDDLVVRVDEGLFNAATGEDVSSFDSSDTASDFLDTMSDYVSTAVAAVDFGVELPANRVDTGVELNSPSDVEARTGDAFEVDHDDPVDTITDKPETNVSIPEKSSTDDADVGSILEFILGG